jgi:hypothetical protein
MMVGLDLGYHERSAEGEVVALGWLAASFAENLRRASRPYPNPAKMLQTPCLLRTSSDDVITRD